jgi:hypothetical protein
LVTVLINHRRAGDFRIHVDAVEMDVDATARLAPSPAQLAARLDADGDTTLDGIKFIGEKREPTDAADFVLSAVARLLAERPAMNLEVSARPASRPTGVGSSAVAAPPDPDLGAARAATLISLLVADHGVAASRLSVRKHAPDAPADAVGVVTIRMDAGGS